MLPYASKRLLGMVLTLFLLATLIFFLLRFAPGGPFDTERIFPPEIQANIEKKYELDRPLYEQYWHWLQDACQGNLRESFQYLGQPVAEIIQNSLPISVFLGILALLFSTLMGIPLGALAAWKQNTWIDASSMLIAVSGVSLPSYLVASLLVLVFSITLGWLPPALWEEPSSIVLPMITLGFRPMAMIARMTRASMIEALQADYIRTAYAKGLSEREVIFIHALKNSLIPILTLLGPLTANLVTGSFLVEVVFQIPGMGKHFVTAVINRDYPLVMGVSLVYGALLLVANLIVDLLYAWADPRIRL